MLPSDSSSVKACMGNKRPLALCGRASCLGGGLSVGAAARVLLSCVALLSSHRTVACAAVLAPARCPSAFMPLPASRKPARAPSSPSVPRTRVVGALRSASSESNGSNGPPPPRLWTLEGSLCLTSSDNDRLKQLRQLVGSKRARAKAGLLVLEGHRLVLDALSAGHVPSTVLVTTQALQDSPLATQLLRVLESLPRSSVALVAPPSLLSSCLHTVTPQGVAAILPQPSPLPLPSVKQGGVLLVLDGVQDPGNVGTLIRSAAATGCKGVLCVGAGADPWGPKAMRAAMGATFRLPVVSKHDWTGVLEGELKGVEVWAAHGGEGLAEYSEVAWGSGTSLRAVVVGGEGAGLSGDVREAMKEGRVRGVRIPLEGDVESLNAAVAGSIILAEAQRQRRAQKDDTK